MKQLYIKTYGCQMNFYDSDRMVDLIKPLGYQLAESPDNADIAIINTCHVREKAEEKLYSDLGRLRAHKQRRAAEDAYTILIVAGCTAQAHGETVFQRAPYVDAVVGPQAYQDLPKIIRDAEAKLDHYRGKVGPGLGVVRVDFEVDRKFDTLPTVEQSPISAFLTIQEGCDKFCHFCSVPYTRGAEYSRPAADILAEARHLATVGAREITLLGQNVNAYHGEGPDGRVWQLAQLLEEMASINGIDRLRYTTSHPHDMTPDLIAVHGRCDKLMPLLHLPVQSGSDRILTAMNRKHTRAEYLKVIEALRTAQPQLQFSSDFIVGYPGETDADFEATMSLVREVGYIQAYSFQYSPRPGTPAAVAHDPVPEHVKEARLQELQSLIMEQQRHFNESMVGKTVPVLFDRRGRKPGQLLGRSPYFQSVYVNASERLFGAILEVEITKATANSLTGNIVLHEAVLTAPPAYTEAQT